MEIDINKYLTEEDIKNIVIDGIVKVKINTINKSEVCKITDEIIKEHINNAWASNHDPELTWYKKFWENQ